MLSIAKRIDYLSTTYFGWMSSCFLRQKIMFMDGYDELGK